MKADISKKISDAIVAYFNGHGATKRDALFQVGIDALKLTKQQLADKTSGSQYNKIRALTGGIINDLVKAGSIKLPKEGEAAGKAVTPKSAQPTDEYAERKKVIFEYLSSKYLTDAEKKDKTQAAKVNVLKSIINDKNKKQTILDGTIDTARAMVEKAFISAAKINSEVTKATSDVIFPNTTIGNFLRNEYDYYLKCNKGEISKDDYEKHFDNAVFDALRINGGEFFENFCLDIVKAVYGESRIVAGTARNVGGANDHGIDSEMMLADEFGMADKLVIQAKLGERGEKVIREFMGSMTFASAQKGIFITALEVDAQARSFVKSTARTARRLTLLGKKELLPLMKKHLIGIVNDKNGIPMLDKNYYIIELD